MHTEAAVAAIAQILRDAGLASETRAATFAAHAVQRAVDFRIRLAGKVRESGDGCLLWTAYANSGGYGVLMTPEGRVVQAHRVLYEEEVGPIPSGMDLDHLCRNRLCVNVEHLEPVTRKENILRGNGTGAIAARRDRCSKGHEYVEGSFYIRKNSNARICRVCHRAHWHANKDTLNAARRMRAGKDAA